MISGLPARGRPVVITQGGRPAAVLLSPAEYDRLTYHARFMAAVNEGPADAEAGRTISDAELRKQLDAAFGPLSKVKPSKTKRARK